MVGTLWAFRAGRLVRTINSLEFVKTDKAYSCKQTRIARKAHKGPNKAYVCTAESLGAYLKSPFLARNSISEDIPSGRQQARHAVDTYQNRFTQPCILLFLCFSLYPACVWLLSQHGTELRGASQCSPSRGRHFLRRPCKLPRAGARASWKCKRGGHRFYTRKVPPAQAP